MSLRSDEEVRRMKLRQIHLHHRPHHPHHPHLVRMMKEIPMLQCLIRMIISKVEVNLHTVCVLVCLSVCLFACFCVCEFVCLSVCLFVCLSLRLSVRVREEGQAVRDNLRLNMPGPTQREQRILNVI